MKNIDGSPSRNIDGPDEWASKIAEKARNNGSISPHYSCSLAWFSYRYLGNVTKIAFYTFFFSYCPAAMERRILIFLFLQMIFPNLQVHVEQYNFSSRSEASRRGKEMLKSSCDKRKGTNQP